MAETGGTRPGPHDRGRSRGNEVGWRGTRGLRDLSISAHPDDVASQRVAEKAGFIHVGIVEHEPAYKDGTRHALRFEQHP